MEELALERELLLVGVEHAPEDLQALSELTHAVARANEGHAEVGELARHPAGAEAGDDASTGDVVDGGDHLAGVGRVAHADGGDERADFGLLGHGGDAGGEGPGLEHGDRRGLRAIEMVVDPERVETHLLEGGRRAPRLLPGALDLRNGHA